MSVRCPLHPADCRDPRCHTHGTMDPLPRKPPISRDEYRRQYLQDWPQSEPIETPETQHERTCAYVTSDGPAPCTCKAGEAARRPRTLFERMSAIARGEKP